MAIMIITIVIVMIAIINIKVLQSSDIGIIKTMKVLGSRPQNVKRPCKLINPNGNI